MTRWQIVRLFSAFLFSAALAITSPAQSTLFTSLATFNWQNGAGPYASLIQAEDGNFYGATVWGGAHNGGTIFKITPAGVLTTLYSFCSQPNCTDGADPLGALMQAADGNFYGTTSNGGEYGHGGTVFKFTSGGTLTTLYSFCAQPLCTDGDIPQGGLVQATDGNFYGTTAVGGDYLFGTVFKLTPGGTLTTLYSFCSEPNCTDGSAPPGALIQASDGNFYGTTLSGGADYNGTVFKITPVGTLTTLHKFNRSDGSQPHATLVQATDGNIYGATQKGGARDAGTIFKMTPSGTLTTLYSFCAQPLCTDGTDPEGGLVQANDGNFYGTTSEGGEFQECLHGAACGTVFKITPTGVLTMVHSFNNSDGANPKAALVQATDGSFYGTTWGGASNYGTVFRIRVIQNCARCRP